jgi:hypothetical protein
MEAEDSVIERKSLFNIGDYVFVESRTWPGINKPGGYGFIKGWNPESNTYEISYVLGGI